MYFNSRPHEEVDGSPLRRYPNRGISTHDLTRRSTSVSLTFFFPENVFQLTTSRGGRRNRDSLRDMRSLISTHDLTRRSTRNRTEFTTRSRNFNSRPHEEVDSKRQRRKKSVRNFNSRPHEEVDLQRWSKGSYYGHFNSRPHEEVDQAY